MGTQSWNGGINCILATHHLYSRPTDNVADIIFHLCLLFMLRLCELCNVICVGNGSNATESIQSDHPEHGHTLPVVLFSAVLT